MKIQRISTGLSTLTALMVLSLAGCTIPTSGAPAPASTTPRPAPPMSPRWIIDHLDGVEDTTTTPPTSTYTAYCASTDMYTPSSGPDDSDFTVIPLSQDDFLRLSAGDSCPLP